MKNTELNPKQIIKIASQWMLEKNFIEADLELLLLQNQLEEERHKPNALFERSDGTKFLMYFLDKHKFSARTAKNESPFGPSRVLTGLFTGFDAWKYIYLQMYEAILDIPVAVLIYNETEQQFYFRLIRELPSPKLYWANKEFQDDIKKAGHNFKFGSKEHRDAVRQAVDRLKRNSQRIKPGMVMWDIESFLDTPTYNPTLFEVHEK